MKQILCLLGNLLSYIYPLSVHNLIISCWKYIYTGYYSRAFKTFGNGSIIKPSFLMLIGAKYISIGNSCYIGSRTQLTAWDAKKIGGNYVPHIIIGDGTAIGDESQITAINSIVLGKNVLLGKKVLITDNSHGASIKEMAIIAPLTRPMVSKGEVVVEDNVWIGEKATIVAGVRIGKGSIIGANSVVTKDVPPCCLVAGCPAIIVKRW